MPRRDWTREELIVAFNLYCKIPFGKIHRANPQLIELAQAIGRSPSAMPQNKSINLYPDMALRFGLLKE
jgi:hypothetical protein